MRRAAAVLSAVLLSALSACGANPPKTSDLAAAQPVAEAVPATTPAPEGAAVAVPRPAAQARPAAPARGPRGHEAARLGGDYAAYPAARALVERLVRERGFDPAYLNGVLSRVERQQWILDFLNRPAPQPSAGPTGAWTRYRARFVTEDHIANGLRFWREHAATLDRAYRQYGVPPEYVVAILGVETRYGGYVGKHRVIDALATIAFDYPRRSDYFTGELEAYLVMARDEGFDPFEPVGSYAGAMGLGQFMPSSFHRYAVDFDGDGRRDLWNPVDAIGSVANYFKGHGWRSGEPVAIRAAARGSVPQTLEAGFSTRYRVDGLARQGVTTRVALDGDGEVSLLRLDARDGYEYWLGLHNFYVITRYNHSTYYAMAVYQLGQALRDRRQRLESTILSRRDADRPGGDS